MDFEAEIIREIGKEGAKGSLHEDWREINREIEAGKSREAAICEYLAEIDGQRQQAEIEFQNKKREFQASSDAQKALMSPETFKREVARPEYDKRVSLSKIPKKKLRTFEDWFKIANHQSSFIQTAFLYESSVNAQALENSELEIPKEYVREGDFYVFRG